MHMIASGVGVGKSMFLEEKIKVTYVPYYGYGENYYRVTSHTDYETVRVWMRQNEVEYQLQTSGSNGYGFTVKSKLEWFMLRWL